MYIRLENNIVTEIIPDFSPEHPNVKITERYEKEFIDSLIHVNDDTDVQIGYILKDGDYVPYEREITVDDIVNERGAKISEMSDACTQTIYSGTTITLTDGTEAHFTLDANDQLNLSGIALKILMGSEEIYWHENDATKPCKKYSLQDAQLIIGILTAFKEYNITYFRDLRIYINSLDDIDEINSIEYGINLPDEYKSEVLKNLESQINLREDD